MDEKNNNVLIPAAIILAGVIIGVAVIYSVKKPSQNAGANPSNGQTAALAALPKVSSKDFILGNETAPVEIVEYGDFQCPFCSRFFKETESALREKYVKTGKIKFVYRDIAVLGQESIWASNAARCANEQGKFWQYHDYLYSNQRGENQGAFSKDNLKGFAAALGLDKGKFNACLDSEKYTDAIQKETDDAGKAGVQGTPTSFINGTMIAGALPLATFTEAIDGELRKLGK